MECCPPSRGIRSLKCWAALIRFADDGELPVDNNWIENQIRPIAIGRNNWLFAGSLRAGKRAAAVMSLIQSARMNGHDSYAYLRDVMARLPMCRTSQIGELLPHRWHAVQQHPSGNITESRSQGWDDRMLTHDQRDLNCPTSGGQFKPGAVHRWRSRNCWSCTWALDGSPAARGDANTKRAGKNSTKPFQTVRADWNLLNGPLLRWPPW